MYSTNLAKNGYAQASAPVRTDRGTEHAVFERITARLVLANRPGATVKARAEALYDNRRLWTRLAADAAAPGNPLPQQLRAQILYLHEFTQAHSRAALRQKIALTPLIEINTAIMRGLRGEGAPS